MYHTFWKIIAVVFTFKTKTHVIYVWITGEVKKLVLAYSLNMYAKKNWPQGFVCP